MNTSTASSTPTTLTHSIQVFNTLRTLPQIIAQVKQKQAVDLIRFRTCCADPRASK